MRLGSLVNPMPNKATSKIKTTIGIIGCAFIVDFCLSLPGGAAVFVKSFES
jgi:hypothetical protein